MPNPENLTLQGFNNKPERINKNGRPKGTRNRSTIAKMVLSMKVGLPQNKLMEKVRELYPSLPKKLTIEELSTLVQMTKAINAGDTQAYKAVLDSAYGAPKVEMEHSGAIGTLSKIEIEVFSEPLPTATSEAEMFERHKHKLTQNGAV
jgi:hypothetical protein